MFRVAVIASSTLLAVIVPSCPGWAQRVQFPGPASGMRPLAPLSPTATPAPAPGLGAAAPTYGGGAYLGGTIQPFDPYALPSNIGTPGLVGPGSTAPYTAPYSGPAGWPGPAPTPLPGGTVSPFGANVAPSLPPPSAPYGSPLPGATGGLQPQPTNPYYNGSPYANNVNPGGASTGPPYRRLFQDTGLRGTYLFGKEKDDLALTEVEASTTAYFANFLGVPNGLRVTPGFVFHWTEGPGPPRTSHVPGRLYSAYLDFGLEPRWNDQFGAELNARVGVYSDFQSFTDDSIRLLGTAVGVWQATPASAFKVGVAYIDRVDVKLLPAIGMLWTPNQQTRWDIFFPAPKLSNYWTTVGNHQLWWYLGGEYGGGSWSIEREGPPSMGADDRIDINDVRVFVGVEWWNLNRFYGFAELGYVFDREVVFFREPGDTLPVDDTFMVRGGVAW